MATKIEQLRDKYNIQPITPIKTESQETGDKLEMARQIVAKRQSTQEPERRNMFQKIGGDIKRRATRLKSTFQESASGKISPVESGARVVGDIIGAGTDVVFRGAEGALRTITPDKLERKVEEGGKKLVSKAMSNPFINDTIEKLTNLAKQNPRASKNIEALIDITSVLPASVGVKATKPIINTAEKIVAKTAQKGAGLSKYGISQATGLARETIEEIIKNPKAFKPSIVKTLNRESLGAKIKKSINERLGAQTTLGKEYDVIRELVDTKVKVGNEVIKPALEKFGLKLDKGVIKMTAESRPFAQSELKRIEDFISLYGKKELSPNAILNAREALSNIAKFETGKSGTLINWAKSTRSNLNEIAHKQLPKLKEIDNIYSAESRILKQIKSDYFKKGTNEFKDNALSKIANLTREGRQPVLARLKEIVPDIEKQVNILRAVEDIKLSSGIKIGTYVKGGLAVGGVVSGNIPLIIGAIFAQPEVIVPVLRAWGKLRGIQKGMVEVISTKLRNGVQLAKDEEKFVSQAIGNWGEKTIDKFSKLKPGLTIEDVSKKGKGEILRTTPLKSKANK